MRLSFGGCTYLIFCRGYENICINNYTQKSPLHLACFCKQHCVTSSNKRPWNWKKNHLDIKCWYRLMYNMDCQIHMRLGYHELLHKMFKQLWIFAQGTDCTRLGLVLTISEALHWSKIKEPRKAISIKNDKPWRLILIATLCLDRSYLQLWIFYIVCISTVVGTSLASPPPLY